MAVRVVVPAFSPRSAPLVIVPMVESVSVYDQAPSDVEVGGTMTIGTVEKVTDIGEITPRVGVRAPIITVNVFVVAR